jgi:hypothetical protein
MSDFGGYPVEIGPKIERFIEEKEKSILSNKDLFKV